MHEQRGERKREIARESKGKCKDGADEREERKYGEEEESRERAGMPEKRGN